MNLSWCKVAPHLQLNHGVINNSSVRTSTSATVHVIVASRGESRWGEYSNLFHCDRKQSTQASSRNLKQTLQNQIKLFLCDLWWKWYGPLHLFPYQIKFGRKWIQEVLSYWLLAHTFTGWEFVQACTFSTSVVYALGVQRHCCKNISFNINVYSTFNITFVTKVLTVTISYRIWYTVLGKGLVPPFILYTVFI